MIPTLWGRPPDCQYRLTEKIMRSVLVCVSFRKESSIRRLPLTMINDCSLERLRQSSGSIRVSSHQVTRPSLLRMRCHSFVDLSPAGVTQDRGRFGGTIQSVGGGLAIMSYTIPRHSRFYFSFFTISRHSRFYFSFFTISRDSRF